MKKSILFATLISALSFGANAQVFDSTSGFTAGGTISGGMMGVTGGTGSLDSKFGYGFNAMGGYNINQHVSVEMNIGGFLGPKSGIYEVSSTNLTLDMIGYYPMGEGHLYGLIGYGSLSTDQSIGTNTKAVSVSKNGVRLGAGMEFGRMTKDMPSLRLGVETYDTGITRTTQVVVGPVWKW